MKVPLADLGVQHRALQPELTAAFEQVMAACDFGGLGASTVALEQEIAAFCGARFGLGVNSGTDALLLGLLALGVGPGDEVVTTPFTFFATAETISLTGATLVFADIDPQTFNLDPELVEAKITEKTKVILPVHLFGQMADVTRFAEIAARHNLRLLYDGAQAIGCAFGERPVGAFGDATTLSFYPTKNLGACGDGGMILTDNEELAAQIKLLRFHGSGGGYFHKQIGYCSRLDGMQAALLRVKARHLHDWNEARRRNAARYDELLGGLSAHLTLPVAQSGQRHVYHQYTVRVLNGQRESLQKHLAANEVQSGVYYPLPIHRQEAYAYLGHQEGDFPESEQASREVLSLPVHPDLSREQIEFAAERVRAFFG